VIDRLPDAVVAQRFDPAGLLVELVLVHGDGRGCTFGERATEGPFVDVPARAFTEQIDHIRTLARAHDGASVTRVARKLTALEARTAAAGIFGSSPDA
jgi:hypothetical protein